MENGPIQNLADVILVVLLWVPSLFGAGYVICLFILVLFRLLFTSRTGPGRWEGLFQGALVFNLLMTAEWVILLVCFAIQNLADERLGPLPETRGQTLPALVLNAWVFSWIVFVGLALLKIVAILFHLVVSATLRLVIGGRPRVSTDD